MDGNLIGDGLVRGDKVHIYDYLIKIRIKKVRKNHYYYYYYYYYRQRHTWHPPSPINKLT